MSLNNKEIEVIEVLTGTYGLDYNFAKDIAIATYGNMNKAKTAADAFNIGRWTREMVLDSLKQFR